MTVTLMGRMLSQMESRMQHTRGTAPPGWADLHSAAKLSGPCKGATMEPQQPEAAAPESAGPPSLPPTPRKPAAADSAAAGASPQQQPRGRACGEREHAQMHVASEAARPAQVADATMQACLWVQSSGPCAPSDVGDADRQWSGMLSPAPRLHACQQYYHPRLECCHWSEYRPCAADLTPPPMAAVDIAAAHHPPAPQRGPLHHAASAMPCNQPMPEAPPAGYAVQGPAAASLPDTQRGPRAASVVALGQPPPDARQPNCGSQRQSSLSTPGQQALLPGTPPAGDVRAMTFRSIMPTMHGPQSLAARAAFDARFDVRMASASMHGPRMADVQVHGSRPAAQQMIPTPALPPEAQAEMDSRKANGSSGAEDTAGAPLAASATAADYLMGAVVPPALDSCMEVDGEEPLRPPLPPPPGLGRQQRGMMWMTAPDCGEAAPQSAGLSATACATDSAWTAVGNSSAEPSMAMGYTWQQGWPGGPPLGMSAGPGMHLPPHALMQQLQREEIGQLLMTDDADVALLGGADLPMDMCMSHMHDESMAQQQGMGVPAMSAAGGQGQMVDHGGKPMRRFMGVGGGQDGGGNPVHDMTAQGDWMQDHRPRQQRVPPWAAGAPAV